MTSGADDDIEALVKRFAVMIASVGRQWRLAQDDLDELVQGVRIRLWRARKADANAPKFGSSYVYLTARSAALDLVRSRRSRAALHADIAAQQDAQAASRAKPDAAASLQADELEAAIERALAALGADRRTAVQLHLAGYPVREIAVLMGWSAIRTRNLVHRGLTQVRDALRAEGHAPEGDAG